MMGPKDITDPSILENLANEIYDLRRRILCMNEEGTYHIPRAHVIGALAHLDLAAVQFRLAALHQASAISAGPRS